MNRGRASVDFIMDQNTRSTSDNSTNNKASNINAGNNINLTSLQDINIAASNLNAVNNITAMSSEGNINITSQSNTQKTSEVTQDIENILSAGIGNAYVDAAYAVDDTVKAMEEVKAAKGELSHMKNLKSQGRATSQAVDDAKANLAMAILNYELALLQQAKAAANAAGAAASSFGTGFYADLRLDTSTTKATTNTSSVTNTASNLFSNNGSITLIANATNPANYDDEDNLSGGGGNITQKGSNLTASNGDVNYLADNNVNIIASKDSFNSSYDMEQETVSVTLASSNAASMAVDNVSGSFGKQSADQKTNSITYNNSQTNAKNINIISNNDTDIIGANLLASNDLTIDVGNNLNVESLQNEYHSKGSSKGFNLGGSSGGSVSFGVNYGKNSASNSC